MRRDSIFYQLFQQAPALLFELFDQPPPDAQLYRFDAVAVKEPRFEIDGVFLPPDAQPPGTVFFCEVQFQKDERLYERLFGESFLYFYRNRDRFSDWQAVVIYPSRTIEQSQLHPYRALLASDQLRRVYLDELGPIDHLPLGVALMVLTTVEQEQAPQQARKLIDRAQQSAPPDTNRAIIELITTIMVYKFTTLSRREVEAMLGIDLQQSRFYQEAREDEARSLILRLLNRKVGELPQSAQTQLEALSIDQLEALGEALLDFSALADLETWLNQQQ